MHAAGDHETYQSILPLLRLSTFELMPFKIRDAVALKKAFHNARTRLEPHVGNSPRLLVDDFHTMVQESSSPYANHLFDVAFRSTFSIRPDPNSKVGFQHMNLV
jgi:hypothetical protein